MPWNVTTHSRYTTNVYSVNDCFKIAPLPSASLSSSTQKWWFHRTHRADRAKTMRQESIFILTRLQDRQLPLPLQGQWACWEWRQCQAAVRRQALHQNLRLFFGTSYKFYLFWIIILHFFHISNESIKAMENVNHINQNRQNKSSFTLK